jgi:hypothetical protein
MHQIGATLNGHSSAPQLLPIRCIYSAAILCINSTGFAAHSRRKETVRSARANRRRVQAGFGFFVVAIKWSTANV